MRLLRLALPDLAHRADLVAVLVGDGVLVVDLDDLGLLVHHQDRLAEHGAAALHLPRLHADLLLQVLLDLVDADVACGTRAGASSGSTACRPWEVTCSVQFVPSK